MNTAITVNPIDTIDTLLAALRAEPTHNYPYRAFAAADDCQPYFERSVLLVRRNGEMFFKCPVAGMMSARLDDADSDFVRSALERWVGACARVVELHPSRVVEYTTATGVARRNPSDYLSALYTALSARARTFGALTERSMAMLRRIDALRTLIVGRDEAPVASWRGVPRLTAQQYLELRRAFKESTDFSEAVRAAVVDGALSDLAEVLEGMLPGSVVELVCDNEWLNEVTGGMLIRADCGHVEYSDEVATARNDQTYCRRCAEEDLVYVTECRAADRGWYRRDDVYYWESDGEYHLEPEPEPEDGDEAHPLLYGWGASTGILDHDRSFVPSWYGDFTMGVELEVETSDYDRGDALEDCDRQLNRGRLYAMFKRDGSLDDSRGFEIVTAARRLADHIEAFKKWQPYDGLRSWDAGNCGMHVHIDSRAFTALTLGKFLQFYNDPANERFIRSIAGRHPDTDSQAKTYAARLDCERPNPARIKKGAGSSRYKIVNLTNLTASEQKRLGVDVCRDSKGSYSTVEIRVFRGSLKKERLLAQIEFAHASVVFCRVAGMHELNGPSFITWLGSVAGQYKNLARWFGVYVPRPTKQRPAPAAHQTADV
jgi:hypothetical protein